MEGSGCFPHLCWGSSRGAGAMVIAFRDGARYTKLEENRLRGFLFRLGVLEIFAQSLDVLCNRVFQLFNSLASHS